MSHTPGPWKTTDGTVDRGSGTWLADEVWQDTEDEAGQHLVATVHYVDTNEECSANARLIAAAPCLLSALTALQQEINNLAEDSSPTEQMTIAQLYSEIQSTEGEQAPGSETMIFVDFVARMETLNEDSVHISESVTPVSATEAAYWRSSYVYQAAHPEGDTGEVLSVLHSKKRTTV